MRPLRFAGAALPLPVDGRRLTGAGCRTISSERIIQARLQSKGPGDRSFRSSPWTTAESLMPHLDAPMTKRYLAGKDTETVVSNRRPQHKYLKLRLDLH